MSPMTTPIYERPTDLLRTLVRYDTTNPPGNEAECIGYLDQLLQEGGLTTTLLAKDANRPNLVTRLPGRGEAPGLVLQGHVDVVTTANQTWKQDPFAANLIDGTVWGRGSLDMKSGVAMMTCAVLRAAAQGRKPAGDVILTIMSDEEAGSDYGASRRGPSSFYLFASPRPGVGIGRLEKAVDDELATILKKGVPKEEVEAAKQQLQDMAIFARDSLRTGANAIATSLTIGRTVQDVEEWPARIGAVTVEQVNAAARHVLQRRKSVTALLLPDEPAATDKAGEQRQ